MCKKIHKIKITISSCLLGENVRYDGFNSYILDNKKISTCNKALFKKILNKCEVFSFCPEVAGGLPTPRDPVEMHKGKYLTNKGKDQTKEFLNGAIECLKFCQKNDIKIALLKAKSPSCGNERIYDGTFTNTLKQGSGACAKILLKNNIKVFNENQLQQLDEYIAKL